VALACYLSFIGESPLSSSSPPPSKHIMVLLVTSDNEQFVVEKDVAERSVLIKNMLEGNSFTLYLTPKTPPHDFYTDVGESDQPIPLPNVSSSVLKKASIFACEDVLFLTPFSRSHRSLNTANITGESDSRPQTPSHKMKPASAPPTSASGTRNSLQSIKRCSLRSSWLQIISTSSLSCQYLFAVNPKHP
jgi:hypothetical protein